MSTKDLFPSFLASWTLWSGSLGRMASTGHIADHFILSVSIDRNFSSKCGLTSEAVPSQWQLSGKRLSHSVHFHHLVSSQCELHFKNQPLETVLGPCAISTKGWLCEVLFFFFFNRELFSSFPRDMAHLKLTMTESKIQCDTELLLVCCWPFGS